jgi:glycosyltransferase involved in cell wall biosynthesis
MKPTLRIALTVDPYIPVPPVTYGGFERVAAGLLDEFNRRGHHVTLYAHPDSRGAARHVPYGRPPHFGARARATELWQVGANLWRHRREFDIIHSFGRLAALTPVLVDRSVPKIQSYGREIAWPGIARGVRLAGPSLTFTACSNAMWAGKAGPRHGRWATVYNGVDLRLYTLGASVDGDAPLVFLGRLERIKGPHTAIAIARRARRRLIIAGNRVDSADDRDFFEREIVPHIDGQSVVYAGPVNDEAKNRLLGRAAALLMPIEWEEPFGIVMVEAMACGTPVIGFRRGSVPEVVDNHVTGIVVSNVDEAAAAVEHAATLDRRRVRARCEQRFSYAVIADEYERLYRDGIARIAARWQHAG